MPSRAATIANVSEDQKSSTAAVERVFRQVEKVTGFRVHAEPDTTLRVIASVRMAGPNLPLHLIRFNPSARSTVDYVLAFQCGFILRLYALEPSARFDVGPSYRGRKEVERLLVEHGRASGSLLPKHLREPI